MNLIQMCTSEFINFEGTAPVLTSVEIEYSSRSGKSKTDPSKPLNQEDLPTLEDKLKQVEDALIEIGKEIDFARRQEVLLKEAGGELICFIFQNIRILIIILLCFDLFYFNHSENMQSRIEWFSIFSIVILLSTSLWQLLYLRKFFTSKKLL
jgi:hypothetical protein